MLLREVAERTGRLVALWQTLGFVHGEQQQQQDLRDGGGGGRVVGLWVMAVGGQGLLHCVGGILRAVYGHSFDGGLQAPSVSALRSGWV